MKIVVLDGFCLNSGDLSWDALKDLGDTTIYDRTPKDKVIERAYGADIILTNKVDINKDIIDALPNLKHIAVMATGYNVVDGVYARQKGIGVSNVPSYSTESVVQTVFSLLFEVIVGAGYHNQTVKQGQWSASPDFCYYRKGLSEISHKTIGIIGYGRIGKRVGDIARAFGMKVLAYNGKEERGHKSNAEFAALDTLFADSDVISLNCPLASANKGMINTRSISLMKKSAIIINTARGQLINEQDLADALNTGRIRGAGVDVLSSEPPKPDNPLLGAKNIVITPHIAWATTEARGRLMEILVSNVAAFIRGEKQNIVNN